MEIRAFLAQVLYFTIFEGAVEGLRDVHISVPVAVRLAHPTTISCEYDLQNDTLNSVKWYKDGREFFRYTPHDKPSTKKIFPAVGVDHHTIDVNQSNASQIHFPKSSVLMSGQYGCKVSADSPYFHTSYVSAHMEVVEPPSGKPAMSGLKSRYNLGEIIYVNCTSSGSRPAVNLTWVLNGKSAPRKHVKMFREVTDTDLVISISTIKFHARETHFPQGRLKLQCTASLHNLYWQTTEKTATLFRRNSASGQPDSAIGADDTPNEDTTDSGEETQIFRMPIPTNTNHGSENTEAPTSGQPNLKNEISRMALVIGIVDKLYFIITFFFFYFIRLLKAILYDFHCKTVT